MRTERELELIAGGMALHDMLLEKMIRGEDTDIKFEINTFDKDSGKCAKQEISYKDAERILLEEADYYHFTV